MMDDDSTPRISYERSASIDTWRSFIPSRLEREDPFSDVPSLSPSPSPYLTSRPATRLVRLPLARAALWIATKGHTNEIPGR